MNKNIKNALPFLLILVAFIGVAQEKVFADLTFEYNDDITYLSHVWLGQPGSDMGTSLKNMEQGSLPYEGFQYLKWHDHQAPIHIEKMDSLTITVGLNYNPYEFYYSGGKGAVKNNYLLERHNAILELETSSLFIEASKNQVQEIIKEKKDSLMAQANALALSQKFLNDEQQFWDYYSMYHEVFYDLLRSNTIDITSLKTIDFPRIDYDNAANHFNYKTYLTLSFAYTYLKVLEQTDLKTRIDMVKNINSIIIKYWLRNAWADQIYKRSSASDDVIPLLERFSSRYSQYSIQAKKIYNKKNRLSVGDAFPIPKVKDFFNHKIDLKKGKGKAAYILLYHPTDQNLAANFIKWNQFFVTHKPENTRFITIGIGTDIFAAAYKEYFLKNQIAGSHTSTNRKEGFKLLQQLGIGYGPVIIKVDSDWNILDFKVESDLVPFNMVNSSGSTLAWKPLLGGLR